MVRPVLPKRRRDMGKFAFAMGLSFTGPGNSSTEFATNRRIGVIIHLDLGPVGGSLNQT